MARLIIMGPPGSGKGTQATRIATHLGVVAISTGELFRAHVDGGTALGVEAKKFLEAGDFVPDSVTNHMVRDRLGEPDVEGGFILDGYPRTCEQADYLDHVLAESGQKLDAVLQLTAPEDELVTRLLNRAGEEGRLDDTEAVILHRLNLYEQKTQAVITLYAERDLLTQIDGTGEVEDITKRTLEALSVSL
ncbi:adenylate kinase [Pseudarthrobacter sp. AG30]|uniref:adenylate kinase n=1 Tax=Pseudarthrobacter sp. AG30 TaxID=2249742 RepID=UPI000D6DE1F4|nr:adenylate kinase [Pseudarthrobacter sp. AG30]RAX15111.1 adenylate kinase [Pseudarthrobacter sp. AG30]